MTVAENFVNAMLAQADKQYSATREPRNRPDITGHTDCSGLQCYGYEFGARLVLPQYEMSSFTMSQWCHQRGTGMSLQRAHDTYGAWVFKGPNQGMTPLGVNGSGGHIAVSMGDGRVFAARGSHVYPNIGFSPFWSETWSYAANPPGISLASTQWQMAHPDQPPRPPEEQVDFTLKPARYDKVGGSGPLRGRTPFYWYIDTYRSVVAMNYAPLAGKTHDAKGELAVPIPPAYGKVIGLAENRDENGLVVLFADGGTYDIPYK